MQHTTPTAGDGLATVHEHLENVAGVVVDAVGRLEACERDVVTLRDALSQVLQMAAWNRDELHRLAPQLAALEARVERRERAATLPATAPDDSPAVRELLAEVQAEHERTRVRLAYLSTFEERLRRLEAR